MYSKDMHIDGDPDDAPDLSTPKPPRGRPKAEAPKVPVTLRVDPDVLAVAYKATGPGWQTRMNDALRLEQPKPPVPDRKKTTQYLSLADFMTDRFGPSATPAKRLGTKRCTEFRERGHTPVSQADFDKAKAEYHALQGDRPHPCKHL